MIKREREREVSDKKREKEGGREEIQEFFTYQKSNPLNFLSL